MRKTSLFDQTIEEALFLTGVLIRDVEAQDRLLIGFYREAFSEETSAAGKDWNAWLYERLLPRIHRALSSGGNYLCAAEEAVLYLTTGEEERSLQKTDSLIGEYYRTKRAQFAADKERIGRIRAAAAGGA